MFSVAGRANLLRWTLRARFSIVGRILPELTGQIRDSLADTGKLFLNSLLELFLAGITRE